MNVGNMRTSLFGVIFILCFGCLQASGAVYDPPVGKGRYILTPDAPKKPVINGAAIFGVRPGSPFLYNIPATGQKPIKYSVDGLPAGLAVDTKTGQITGRIESKHFKRYSVTFKASNKFGCDKKKFTIVVGNEICLTPPMGWNSWNAWGHAVTQQRVFDTAKAMVDKGFVGYGWTYVNIDDGWQGLRGGSTNAIQSNPEIFPDMKKLCDDIHGLGLKVGIYSSPWVTTYGGFVGGSSDFDNGHWTVEEFGDKVREKNRRHGKYKFDMNDARQWGQWGVDYLKYDWSGSQGVDHIKRMADALEASGRDIVYSLSNSARKGQKDAYLKYANCWRTTADLKDRWDQPGRLLNVINVWDRHLKHLNDCTYGIPGHFPDADMMVIGPVVEDNEHESPRPSRLNADEQYSHVSLWVMWACPMLIGCPVDKMSDFEVKLFCNSEVIAIHQDEKAQVGRTVSTQNNEYIMVKDLADGSRAIGLFNRNDDTTDITVNWDMAGLKGKHLVRDVWRQNNIGKFEGKFTARVRPHGVILLRVFK